MTVREKEAIMASLLGEIIDELKSLQIRCARGTRYSEDDEWALFGLAMRKLMGFRDMFKRT